MIYFAQTSQLETREGEDMKKTAAMLTALLLAILIFGTPAIFEGCNNSVLASPKIVSAAPAALPTPQGPVYFSNLVWTPVTVASCTAPCQISYNVFRGTAAGGEAATPVNGNTIGCSGASCSYMDTSAPLGTTSYPGPTTLFYTLKAVEGVSSSLTITSAPSAEFNVVFPAAPPAPTGAAGVPSSQ